MNFRWNFQFFIWYRGEKRTFIIKYILINGTQKQMEIYDFNKKYHKHTTTHTLTTVQIDLVILYTFRPISNGIG